MSRHGGHKQTMRLTLCTCYITYHNLKIDSLVWIDNLTDVPYDNKRLRPPRTRAERLLKSTSLPAKWLKDVSARRNINKSIVRIWCSQGKRKLIHHVFETSLAQWKPPPPTPHPPVLMSLPLSSLSQNRYITWQNLIQNKTAMDWNKANATTKRFNLVETPVCTRLNVCRPPNK